VLAFFDRVRQVLWPKMRRRRQDNDINAAVDYFLVCVEADEHVIVRHLNAILNVLLPTQLPEAHLGEVGKRIAHRYEHIFRTGHERIFRRPGPAPAAADETNLDLLAHASVNRPRHGKRAGQRRTNCQPRCLEKTPTRCVLVIISHVITHLTSNRGKSHAESKRSRS